MKSGLEKFIEDNSGEMDIKTPNPEVLARILQQMKVKPEAKQRNGILISFSTLRWAAAALVLLACGITLYLAQNHGGQQVASTSLVTKKTITLLHSDTTTDAQPKQTAATDLPDTRNRDEVDRQIAQRKSALLAKFSSDNTASRKLIMLAGLKDMDSPAKRITAVAQAGGFKMVGRDIITALLHTLNNDPNTNVRLAALDGLARFYRETYIRKQLIVALKTQQNPTVQIALIELLTRMKEAAVLAELDKIVASDSTMTAVKDCAYSGIFKLRKS
ncbi:HEAT repeat protein [Mucilaginibacter gracilis]|uniref:HEAT repeat protein n=1 Tax=Mucilaginibacter gracilis TaxID=423350 RepID=A0A495J895_9SPHI|nr:HEAT repeat domain-containing protein [Mucilaginibacter gracilis]RKR85210.1 HEAT repeat protein [Mucilaginibacter gracilis]